MEIFTLKLDNSINFHAECLPIMHFNHMHKLYHAFSLITRIMISSWAWNREAKLYHHKIISNSIFFLLPSFFHFLRSRELIQASSREHIKQKQTGEDEMKSNCVYQKRKKRKRKNSKKQKGGKTNGITINLIRTNIRST